jgi:hypothetical protein
VKALKITLPLVALLSSLVFLTPLANASAPTTGSGSFTSTATNIQIRQAGGNTIITATEIQTLSGLLNGTRIAEGIQVNHPDGTFTASDIGTFTGTVEGRSGTVVISGASNGVGLSGTGVIVASQGTGGLAALRGSGTFQPRITGPTTAEGTYTLDFHFDP